ncbi:universal stress protein [Bradyrhizobium sp.]|uniref:universal stress protein n=1 Tax=Bradyrhizobium sp. TaxID=376 RepID=UPI0040380431
MFKSLYIPFDNSPHALASVDLAIELARCSDARITTSHVYAAALHDRRFRQMESGLPEEYLKEDKLVEQRDIHDDLITRGLQIISESYLDVVADRCAKAGLDCERVALEGKNWKSLVSDITGSTHDLVILGSIGLGAVDTTTIGSVCERVVRRIDRDVWIVKDRESDSQSPIVAALDGSAHSFGGLRTALWLGKTLGREVEAIAAFDPYFHYVAFNRIAGVLSPEAASVFRFQEQEKLHEEIIDSGLAKIYQAHLDVAKRIASDLDVPLRTKLLAGKAFEQVLRYARERMPWLLVVGRIGVHSDADMDLGSVTENVLRLAPCNVLLSARTFHPPIETMADTTLAWTKEAEQRLARVPASARAMAKTAIMNFGIQRAHTVITSDVIDACLEALMPPGAREVMQGVVSGRSESAKRCPFAHEGEASFPGRLVWPEKATNRIEQIVDPAIRANTRLRVEKLARARKLTVIDDALVEEVVGSAVDRAARSDDVTGMAWDEAAVRRLARVPEGFMRDRARFRIEEIARAQGLSRVTEPIADAGLKESRQVLSDSLGPDVASLIP